MANCSLLGLRALGNEQTESGHPQVQALRIFIIINLLNRKIKIKC